MVGQTKNSTEKLNIEETIDSIINKALAINATFIHIEPGDKNILIRYRVDRMLVDGIKLPEKQLDNLVSKLKTLASLNTKQKQIPQDGRYIFRSGDNSFSLRLSFLPTIGGEKVAIQINKESEEALSLSKLGYWGSALDRINKSIQEKSGLILLAGPTNSGKSTSLFSMLSNLSRPELSIYTVEDPVENKISGAIQTQVNIKTNLTFASGLRSLLMQDANVIMISELTNNETTALAFKIASEARLVLSTIYATDATVAIKRLISTGVEPSLVARVLRTITSQRVVRRLCQSCKQEFEINKTVLAKLIPIFGVDDPSKMKYIHRLEIAYRKELSSGKVIKSKDFSSTETRVRRLWKASSEGCEKCHHRGYMDQIGIYEVMLNNLNLQKLIVGHASSKVIYRQAVKDGMVPMIVDGFIKALAGQTSIEEILRISSESFIGNLL